MQDSTRWWKQDDEKLNDFLQGHVATLLNDQRARKDAMLHHLQLFHGHPGAPGVAPDAYLMSSDGDVLSLNVIASIVRTMRAKLVKSRPRPMVLTDGGSQEMQLQARGLQQFLEGALYECRSYRANERVFDDAAICGTGVKKIYADLENEKIRSERVFPWELLVDDQDGLYDDPRAIYHVKHVDREVLEGLFPEKARDIERCSSASDYDFPLYVGVRNADQVRVVEAWRLPASKKSPGKHVISIGNALLLSEDWTRPRFPFARLRLEPDPVGFWGTGIAGELEGIQNQINDLLDKVQESHGRLGKTFVFVEVGSKVNDAHLNDEVATICEYTGTPPVFATPTVLPPETYRFLWDLVSRAYEIIGISQMGASAVKPAGLNSGKALRTLHDVESERFSYMVRAVEDFVVDEAGLMIDAAKDLAEVAPDFAIKAPAASVSNALARVKWREVAMDEDAYTLQVFPVSWLASRTPEGQMQGVQDLIDLQVITPTEARMLLDFPDLRARLDPFEASYRLTMRQIEETLQAGTQAFIEPYQDLSLAFRLFVAAYLDARAKAVPEEKLDILRESIETIEAMQKQAAPPPAPPPPAAPAPQGAPV